jgi:hypothetical protein
MARLYKTDGSVTDVMPESGEAFTLEELYRLLHCETIEAVTLRSGLVLVLDEEGKLKRPVPPENLNAELLALGVLRPDDYIVGDALLCTAEQLGGGDA